MSSIPNPALYFRQPVRAFIAGRMQTVFLTDFDPNDETFHGFAARSFDAQGQQLPILTPVHGLRPYPYNERPDYSFQFVICGEDESVLLDIANRNSRLPQDFNSPEQVADRRSQVLGDYPTTTTKKDKTKPKH